MRIKPQGDFVGERERPIGRFLFKKFGVMKIGREKSLPEVINQGQMSVVDKALGNLP